MKIETVVDNGWARYLCGHMENAIATPSLVCIVDIQSHLLLSFFVLIFSMFDLLYPLNASIFQIIFYMISYIFKMFFFLN